MTDTGLVKTIRCEGCGRTLKPAALFCTGCGTRRDVEPAPAAAAGVDCPSCGVSLRPGAEFCTACGEKSHSPIDLTGEAAAGEGTVVKDAPTAPADRVSPAASRAILGSVAGGMGSYVGKAGAKAGAPPPPVLPTSHEDDGDHHRRNVAIIAIVAAVLVLIGGIAILFATQKPSDGSLKAGQGSRRGSNGSILPGKVGDATTDSSTGSSSSSGSSGSTTGSKGHSSGSSGSASTSGSSSGTGGKSSSSGSGSSGTTNGGTTSSGSKTTTPRKHGGTPTKVTTPPTTAPVPPAKLDVNTGSISVTGDTGSSVSVSNTGGKKLYWSISQSAIDNGSLHFSATSGSVNPGSSSTVNVSWSGGSEGTGSGSFRVNGNGSYRTVSVSGDSRAVDDPMNVRQNGCASSCHANDEVSMQIHLKALGDFTPTGLEKMCFKVANGTNPAQQCASYATSKALGRASTVYQANYGWVATIYWNLRWNDFTVWTTKVEFWSVDLNGVETAHETLTIIM